MKPMSQQTVLKPLFIVVIVSLFFFYEFGINNIFDVLEKPIAETYHLGSAMMGFIASLYLYANLLFLLPAGSLLDRYSPRLLISGAIFLCAMGVFMVALSHSLTLLISARVLMGIGGGFCFVGCMRIAVNWLPPRLLARAAGLIITMGMLGGFMVQAPFDYLVTALGWRAALSVVGFVGLAIMVLIFTVVRDYPSTMAKAEKIAFSTDLPLRQSLKAVLMSRQNWSVAIFGGCMNIPLAILGAVWGVPYLHHVHQLSLHDAAGVTGMLFIGTMIGSPLMGWISDVWCRRKPIMVIGVISALIVFVVSTLLQKDPIFLLYAVYFLLGFVTSVQAVCYPIVAESNSPALAGSATSIISMMMVLGGIIGQPLYGALVAIGWNGAYDNGAPSYLPSHYAYAIWAVPVFFLVSLLMLTLIRETFCRRVGD